ncbi:hypothetical protein LS482_08020 [Sinomicrobium kalidii]|uniref:hypothetical protein n=1 Tax=Sinomicrobium kalidii TaxID=2900738 RepID=UPI001E368C33|nr:hypothetical protein [Sinomicrobium kalidii]UGU17814.1 hypothetical protein LS482_08020 [Sinomicrobium kalidii]
MKQWSIVVSALVFCLFTPATSEAQLLKKLKKKLEKKAEEAVEKQVDDVLGDGNPGGEDNPAKGGSDDPFRNLPKTVYDFTPGGTIIFQDDFSQDAEGNMASKWTSNGTGAVETLPGVPGKWLRVYPENTYKIKDLMPMPENFTLEFDMLTRAENYKDLGTPAFGFDYNKGIKGHYYLTNQKPINADFSYQFGNLNFTSKEVGSGRKSSEMDFPMSYFVNDVMKVQIEVIGSRMRVFANKYKVLDTEMANPESKKYFYFASDGNEHSRIYIGNFRIAAIKE